VSSQPSTKKTKKEVPTIREGPFFWGKGVYLTHRHRQFLGENFRSKKKNRALDVFPGTPNNQLKMDVWLNNHFPLKDLESSK